MNITAKRNRRIASLTPAMSAALVALSLGFAPIAHAEESHRLKQIQHIIVVYQENWSFDSLYGKFPGANGFSNAFAFNAAHPQVDVNGNLIMALPQPFNNGSLDPRIPGGLPVQPYDLSRYLQPSQATGDIIHRFYHEQLQIDAGTLDKFVTWSDNGGLVFSYFDASALPEGKLAQKYVMADNFFHSAFGGSFLNHQFLVAARAPVFPNAPASSLSNPDPAHLNDNRVTPDGFAVNTIFTKNLLPSFSNPTDPNLLPSQNDSDSTKANYIPTIGDRLSEKGLSSKWYSGGWDLANTNPAAATAALFQWHHQPFAYYDNYAPGMPERAAHLQDEQNFFSDLLQGTLPAVSFVKPLGPDNEHPGYANLVQGQNHVAAIVQAVKDSKYWKNSAIIVTYDENGGRWDHVPPPVIDRFGPGTRVPAIIISHFAKRHFVDHTPYETLSILKFIENRFGLRPLTARDADANDLTNAFNLGEEPEEDDDN